MRKFLPLCILVALFTSHVIMAQNDSPDPYADETIEQRNERMTWWRDARFGMFIHWGVYAVPAGTYKDAKIDGIGEWIMRRARIPVAEYKAFAREFNPSQYDPVAWAQLAKRAGMRYMVITSKHHDGFALFPSEVTDWDIADASPYGEDLIGPLAEAARAEGLKFGLYYSQAQDWTHPGGAKSGFKEGEGWDDAHTGDFDDYLQSIAEPQVREILARYRPDVLWWDTPIWMNTERAARLIPLIREVPGIIHNNRLGGDFRGDTNTPEQHIPATGLKDRDWEVCMTMNDTWGYKSYDQNWKSTEDLIQKLCDIASKGGNFLLNVGPTADGKIPQPSIERLEEVGAWMNVNGESIYGTSANPFHKLPWGRATKRITETGATMYLHVFDWPTDGKLFVPGLRNEPESVSLLQGGETLAARSLSGHTTGVEISLPATAPDPYASVIKLVIDGELKVEAILPGQTKEGRVELMAAEADLHNRGYGAHMKLETKNNKANIGFWSDPRAWAGWTFEIDTPGVFTVSAHVALEKDSALSYQLSGQKKRIASVGATNGYEHFATRELGQIDIQTAGIHTIELRAQRKGWNPVNVRSLTLTPVE